MKLDGLDFSHSGKPICGIHACHVLTGRSIEFIKTWYLQNNRVKKRWRGSTYSHQTRAYIRKWCTLKQVKPIYKTVGKFVKEETTKKEKYLIYVSGHVCTVVNGKIIDQGGAFEPDQSWNRNKRIKSVWRVRSK